MSLVQKVVWAAEVLKLGSAVLWTDMGGSLSCDCLGSHHPSMHLEYIILAWDLGKCCAMSLIMTLVDAHG
jgi:hypothetical protein